MQSTENIIFGTLNEEQDAAVKAVSGPVLILAGAGSGKTKALTHRIAFLMDQGVKPWQILAVTFTNKAANEMKERIKNLLHLTEGEDVAPSPFVLDPKAQNPGRLPVMGTFHSICVRILRRDIEKLGRDRNFVIYDQDDQEKMMKTVFKAMQIDEAELKPRAALSAIGRFKSEALLPHEVEAQATTDRMQKIKEVYTQYQKMLRASNALDFDDLLLETVRLFHECPEVLDRYQETWRYLHVDEYQDTNHAQYLFITMLAKKYRNLCVIGDPDQSIYGFRGADIRNILQFESEYTEATRIKLERNYRSTQQVLSAADAVIACNPNRPQKKMWTERTDGPNVVVHEVRDEKSEAEEIVRSMKQLQAQNIPLREQVILYRTHAQSRLFEEGCMRAGIPYRILGGLKFYLRKEVKDVLAYLYAILNPYDTISVLRIINVPARKIGDTTLEKVRTYGEVSSTALWDALLNARDIASLDEGAKERIGKFTGLIERLRERSKELTVSELASLVIEETGMRTWLADNTEEGEERWRNVMELQAVMRKYDHLDPATSLTSFLEEAALVSEVDKLTEGGKDAVTLMTLHLCKGLEFEAVHIAGCEEGLFPHSNSMFDKEQLEEERRIMYVGMTRAKTYLKMFFARHRFQWGEDKSNPPSRFLDDLPDAVTERRSDDILSAFAWSAGQPGRAGQGGDLSMEFNQDFGGDDMDQSPREGIVVGAKVRHPSFGTGKVTSKRGDIVEVAFSSGEKKTFALSIAPLTVIG